MTQHAKDGWNGYGWYAITYSDSGMNYTNDGAVWIEDLADFESMMNDAKATETETHIACADYLGDWSSPGRLYYAVTEHHNGWDETYAEFDDADTALAALAKARADWPDSVFTAGKWVDLGDYSEFVCEI